MYIYKQKKGMTFFFTANFYQKPERILYGTKTKKNVAVTYYIIKLTFFIIITTFTLHLIVP